MILKKIPHARNEPATNEFASNCLNTWAKKTERFSHRCISFLKWCIFKWRVVCWRIFKWHIFWWRNFALERKNTTCEKMPSAGIELTIYDYYPLRLIIWSMKANDFHKDDKLLFNVLAFCAPDSFSLRWGSAVALPTQPRSGWLYGILWWKIAWKLSCKSHYLIIPKRHGIHFVVLQ